MKLKAEYKFIIIYLIIGLGWIFFSDTLLMQLTSNLEQYNQLQYYKGSLYVIITAVIFFLMFKSYLDHLRKKEEELESKSEELTAFNEEIIAMNEELNQALGETNELNNRFIKMINTVSRLNENNFIEEDEFLSDLLHSAVEIIPEADYGKIYVCKDKKLKFIETVGHDLEGLKKVTVKKDHLDKHSDTSIYQSSDYAIKIDDLSDNDRKIIKKALKPIKESIHIDIEIKGAVLGRISLDIAEESDKSFHEISKKLLNSFSTIASSFFKFKRYENLQGRFTKELISSIINILEMYDLYTKGHSENVANISLIIAEEMGLSDEMVLDAYWSGMVHDIGKLLIPINILNKKVKLTDAENNLIKKHPEWSSNALSGSDTLHHISKYVLHHHERWDGNGYPKGLENNEIPIISQILTVADSWDAMRSNRAYRKPLTKEEAMKEIRKNRGSQFAPKIVDVFIDILSRRDLEDKKKLSDKLKQFNSFDSNGEKEIYFQKLFEKSKEGFVITDENLVVKDANKFFMDLFGYEKSEILGVNLDELIAPAERLHEFEENIEHMGKHEELQIDTYRKRKDGKRIDVNIHAFSVKLGKGKVNYYIIYRDISSLKNAKRNSTNYENRYKAIFNNENTVMLIIDPANGEIIDANPAAEEFYGYDKKELTSMKISDINTLTDNEVKKEMEYARTENKNYFIFKHQLKNGEIKEVEVYSQPIMFGEKEMLYSIIHNSRCRCRS